MLPLADPMRHEQLHKVDVLDNPIGVPQSGLGSDGPPVSATRGKLTFLPPSVSPAKNFLIVIAKVLLL